MHEKELLGFWVGRGRDFLLRPERDLFTEQTKVWFMRDQPEHNQIGVQTVQTVPDVGVVAGHRSRRTNVLHDFVFSL